MNPEEPERLDIQVRVPIKVNSLLLPLLQETGFLDIIFIGSHWNFSNIEMAPITQIPYVITIRLFLLTQRVKKVAWNSLGSKTHSLFASVNFYGQLYNKWEAALHKPEISMDLFPDPYSNTEAKAYHHNRVFR